MKTIVVACCLSLAAACDVAAAEPAKQNSFGIRPEWVASPTMLAALERLHQAGVVEGRRGSLTFFRWSNATPPRLAHLGLWGSQITNDLLHLTSETPDLEFVSLYETAVDDDGIAELAKLPKLRYLAVAPICRYEKSGFGPPQWSYPFLPERNGRPRITGRGLASLASVATLEGLDLLDARLTSGDLSILQSWPKLSSLGLPNELDAEAVRHLQACRRLNRLTIGHRTISAEEIDRLAALKSLRELRVIHARLSDVALAAFAKVESLETLVLEDCGLTDDRLPHLRMPRSLTSLTLERNEIVGPGLAHLAGSPIRTLGLEFNNIDDATLTQLKPLTNVVDLRLAYCRGITDVGIRSRVLQGMTHVERLNLRGLKQITDASLDELATLKHLKHIGLRETSISADGIARLKAALPQTDVFK